MNLAQRPARGTDSIVGRVLTRRPAKVVLALTVCAALGAVPAYAVWSVLGTGSTTATARTLTTPAAPSVGSPTVSSLVVSGTLPSGQVPTTTYAVKRGSTTVCTPSVTPWSCTDTGLSASTAYSYTVVVAIGSWTATSAATSGTTSAPACATPDTFTVNAPAMTAGAAASVTLTARKCDGTLDTSYTGSKALTWAAVAASPSGKAAVLPASATFSGGTATISVTLYATGSATLTPTAAGGVTGSATTTVSSSASAGAYALGYTDTVNRDGTVTMSCPGTDFPTTRSCTQSGVSSGNSRFWSAKVQLLDTWGNPVTTTSPLTITITASGGTVSPATVSVPANASKSSAAFTVSLPNGSATASATATTTFSATPLSITVTGAR